jgi:phosphoglycerol transferase MdoB-like AlkP superfamily enzyme
MKEPFMTAVFTASSHHPFDIPEKYKTIFPEGPLEIHKCIRYTDMAIGKFFETARRQKWFENTIFVLTSDHTNMSDHKEYQTDLGGFCSPIIIYDPQKPDGEIQDKIAQQIDIMPTVLGLLGYQKPYLAFGIDVLNTPAEDTWAVNYLNGVYQYVKHGEVIQFDGKIIKGEKVKSEKVKGEMERELKAIIQQYMERMTQDRLKP